MFIFFCLLVVGEKTTSNCFQRHLLDRWGIEVGEIILDNEQQVVFVLLQVFVLLLLLLLRIVRGRGLFPRPPITE